MEIFFFNQPIITTFLGNLPYPKRENEHIPSKQKIRKKNTQKPIRERSFMIHGPDGGMEVAFCFGAWKEMALSLSELYSVTVAAIFISIRITNPKNEAARLLTQHSIFIRTTLAKQFCSAREEYLCGRAWQLVPLKAAVLRLKNYFNSKFKSAAPPHLLSLDIKLFNFLIIHSEHLLLRHNLLLSWLWRLNKYPGVFCNLRFRLGKTKLFIFQD